MAPWWDLFLYGQPVTTIGQRPVDSPYRYLAKYCEIGKGASPLFDTWMGGVPEHLHCVIELPRGDADFATRWRLIKLEFSKSLPVTERRSRVRQKRGERGYMATAVLGTSDLQ